MLIDQLERDLHAAAERLARRRRRRRRASLLLAPSFACVAAVAVAVLGQGPDTRPPSAGSKPASPSAVVIPAATMRLVAQRLGGELPSSGALALLESHFSVFRRPAGAEDRLTPGSDAGDPSAPHPNRALIRLIAHTHGVVAYAAPVRRAGHNEVCIVVVAEHASGTGCAPIAAAVSDRQPTGSMLSDAAHKATLVRLLPDGVRDFSVQADRRPIAVTRGENAAVAGVDPTRSFSETWQDATGRRHSLATPGTG